MWVEGFPVVQWLGIFKRMETRGFNPWSEKIPAHAQEQLSPCATTTETHPLELVLPNSEKQEWREAPTGAIRKPVHSNKDPAEQE